jgi:general secretion pathway protein C
VLKNEIRIINTTKHLLLLMLLIYSAYLLAKLFWFVLMPVNISDVLVLPSKSFVEQKNEKTSVRLLSTFHLFGKAGRVTVKPKNETIVAPKTNLRLVLKGVFTAKDGGASGAIIEEIGKSAEYYGIGSVLPGNATLEEVYEDRVLLRRNGRLETLSFDEKSLDSESQITKQEKPKQPSGRLARNKDENVKTPEQFIEEATRQIGENPEQALKSVGLNASAEGYVYQGGNPMLSGLNLKKGDVIRSVNGHALGDVKKDKNLMKSLYEQGSLEVEIVRDGASFYINYPLR